MSGRPSSIAVYGAGRVGLAIARRTRERGGVEVGLWNPRPLRPARAALTDGLPLTIAEAPPALPADLWLVAVPDDAIGAVAAALATAVSDGGAAPRAAAHCAGAHPAALLSPLADVGVACGSWHPAMTFRGAAGDADALGRSWVAIEGDPRAVTMLEAFSDGLAAAHHPVAADRKAHYHAALVLASNGRVALDAAAADLLRQAGFDGEDARSLLAPLVARTDENLRVTWPAEALTGPVVRGDAETVRAQIAALADRSDLLALYRALGVVALNLVPDAVCGDGHRTVRTLIHPTDRSI